MTNIEGLNLAITVLKNECRSHEVCDDCPMYDKYLGCGLDNHPQDFELVKDRFDGGWVELEEHDRQIRENVIDDLEKAFRKAVAKHPSIVMFDTEIDEVMRQLKGVETNKGILKEKRKQGQKEQADFKRICESLKTVVRRPI